MEQSPVFAQLYLNIDKLGHNDNIGERSDDQKVQAQLAAAKKQEEELGSTLNNRVSGTDEDPKVIPPTTDSLGRDTLEANKLSLPQRNLFVQFKAFPNLESLKSGTVWQKDGDAEFNYKA